VSVIRDSLRAHYHNRLLPKLREGLAHTPLICGSGSMQERRQRLHIAPTTSLNDAVLNVMSGTITIEEHAFFGHGVSLLTGSHDPSRRGADRMFKIDREGRDIVIETGAWLASNVTVVAPCRIGAHAVVAAGAVVLSDVAPGEIVGGIPAQHLGWVKSAEPAAELVGGE
jgi:acetyltransferase-like isoleucine patch superfamily enzyme